MQMKISFMILEVSLFGFGKVFGNFLRSLYEPWSICLKSKEAMP